MNPALLPVAELTRGVSSRGTFTMYTKASLCSTLAGHQRVSSLLISGGGPFCLFKKSILST
jgi:hypothetical protein